MKKTKPCHCCDGTGKEYNNKAVGTEMIALRAKSGLTQSEVGERMGFAKAYVSDLERGNRNWSSELIEKFRKACV